MKKEFINQIFKVYHITMNELIKTFDLYPRKFAALFQTSQKKEQKTVTIKCLWVCFFIYKWLKILWNVILSIMFDLVNIATFFLNTMKNLKAIYLIYNNGFFNYILYTFYTKDGWYWGKCVHGTTHATGIKPKGSE